MNQSHCKLNTLKFQSHLLNWYKFIQPLYQKYVPSSIRHRRNIQHCKLDDVLVISLLCWQVELKITTQLRFYYFLQNNIFPKSSLPESYEQATCMGKMANQIIDIIKKKGYEIDFTKYEVNITELAHYSVYATSDE